MSAYYDLGEENYYNYVVRSSIHRRNIRKWKDLTEEESVLYEPPMECARKKGNKNYLDFRGGSYSGLEKTV
jgi:hypothetical protein